MIMCFYLALELIYKLKNQLDDVYKMKKECKNELKSLDPNSEEYNISTILLKQLNEHLNSTFNFIQSMINNHHKSRATMIISQG